MRRRARVDGNQASITAALRKLGCVVTPIHQLGHGVPDLLISWRQAWYVLELKDGSLPESRRRLTPDEKKWIGAQRAPVYLVQSVTDALNLFSGRESLPRSTDMPPWLS